MESLPPRQTPQQRQSPAQNSSDRSSQQQPQATSSPVRARSEDSQTLFLNTPPEQEQQQPTSEQEESRSKAQTDDGDGDSAAKKCWICFSDSTEDTPETSPWRDPCPCALVAHEECLLDWIADMEAPNNRRSQRGMAPPKIECPQCKSEIKLARPRNLIVEGVRAIERAGAQMVTPGALAVLSGMLYHSSMMWGVHSIYAVFGAQDGFRILRPLVLSTIRPPLDLDAASPRDMGERLLGVTVDHLVHWRLYVGLPLITPILILSRTSLADSVLPVLPILFFATQTPSPQDTLDFGQWPPSASLSFAVLPYLRSAYNLYYQKVWAKREKQWLQEIQPRVREGQTDDGGTEAGAQDREDGNVFEVRIDGGILEEWEEDFDDEGGAQARQDANEPPPIDFQQPRAADEQQQQQPQQQQPQEQQADQADPPPNIRDNRQQQPAVPQGQNPAPANQPGQQQQQQQAAGGAERRLSFSPTAIAETVMGALVFPTIASLSGEVLKLALPRSWTTAPSPANLGRMRLSAKGLLQEKWGRSLVGGCLFVVMKDFVMLYVRWKMAQMHRQRKVVDYQGKRTRTAST